MNFEQYLRDSFSVEIDGQFQSFKAPIIQQDKSESSSLLCLITQDEQQKIFELNMQERSLTAITKPAKILHYYYLMKDYFLTIQLNEQSALQINVINKVKGITAQFENGNPRNSKLSAVYQRVRILLKHGIPPYEFTLYLLDKKEESSEMKQGNLFELRIFSVQMDSITVSKPVDFTATVRSFEIQLLECKIQNLHLNEESICLMYNPTHLTTNKFQFLIWNDQMADNNKIKVMETCQDLKGTVISVLPVVIFNNLLPKYREQQNLYAIIIYNSNGVNSPYLIYYDIDTQDESNIQLSINTPYLIEEVIYKKEQTNNEFIYLIGTNFSVKTMIIFSLKLRAIVGRVQLNNEHVELIRQDEFLSYFCELGGKEMRIELIQMVKSELLTMHYYLSVCQKKYGVDVLSSIIHLLNQ